MKHVTIMLMVFFIPIFLIAQTEKVKISGEYSYTYGDREILTEAKEICYTMALRHDTYHCYNN